VAVHECDARGYREMSAIPPTRLGAWWSLVGISVGYVVNLLLGAVWIAAQAGAYAVAGRGRRREQRYFAGKTVLVTGAGRGLGLALTERLLSLGANVVALSRPGVALERLGQQATEAGFGERLRAVPADVAVTGAVAAALSAAGVPPREIDVAIVNAGIKEAMALPYPDEALRRVFDVNVFGAIDTANAVLPHFLERGTGHLVFISSQGRWHGMTKTGAYNASKAALSLLVESMAMDLGPAGRKAVRITNVEPGLIRTGMVAGGLLQRLLAVDAGEAAARILRSVAVGSGTSRFPRVFALMTTGLALLPRSLRVRMLGEIVA
jgi:NAD(P)-dependent dehydrogenase (short-subunit alcohol dehydrogenase family)